MDYAYVGHLVATGLGGMSIKPLFDHLSGRTKAKADRITELETKLTELMLREQLRQEQEEKRLLERRRADDEDRARDEAERRERQAREEKRHQDYVRKESMWRDELNDFRVKLGIQSHQMEEQAKQSLLQAAQMAQLNGVVAELQSTNEQLTDHVATLQDQLKELGQVPRDAKGRFSPKSTPKGKKQ